MVKNEMPEVQELEVEGELELGVRKEEGTASSLQPPLRENACYIFNRFSCSSE